MEWSALGRVLLVTGAFLLVAGLAVLLVGRGPLPHLPGDFSISRGSVRVWMPLGTCIVLSLVLTAIFNFFLRR